MNGDETDIVLTTLNVRYAHASFGLRYLLANLPETLQQRATMLAKHDTKGKRSDKDALDKLLGL